MAFEKIETPVEQIENKPQLTFRSICEKIITLQESKGTGYKVSPFNELPVDVWLAQIQIKATRAKYATSEEKQLDELQDTAVYCLLTMMKLQGATIV